MMALALRLGILLGCVLAPLSARAGGFAFWQAASAISQQAYVKDSGGKFMANFQPQMEFGHSVALSGDTMAVSARAEDSNATGIGGTQTDNSASDSGAVYVFTRSGSVWTQQAYIKASNTEANDDFGESVSLSGDTLAVSADGEDSNATGIDGNQSDNSAAASGAVYVFTRSGSVWSQQAYIKASNTDAGDAFGISVSVSGDSLAVGARNEDSNSSTINGDANNNTSSNRGAAYVFTRSGSVWTQQAYIKAANGGSGDLFGDSVSLHVDTLAVGAPNEDSNATGIDGANNNLASNAGAAYVFTRSGGVWTQQAYVKASNTDINDEFGTSVSVYGDTLAVGADGEASIATGIDGNQADNTAAEAGAVYVFTRSGSVWTQQAYIKASNTGAGDYFGRVVSIHADTLAVCAKGEDSNSTGINGADNSSANFSGAVYVFTRSGSTWTQQAFVKASNTDSSDQFGNSVAVDSDTLVVGATHEDSIATGINGNQADNSTATAGAAYVFTRSGSVWTQQAYVKSSNTTYTAPHMGAINFGFSVSLSGATLAVGATEEDSATTGINGAQNSNSSVDSGAVYVFTKSGSTWSQQAYIKASNTGAGDFFGYSVSVDVDTLAVGATSEDSNATGIGGTQSNNSLSGSGAVYVFTRSGGVWSQQAYIKSSNTGAGDAFGNSVSVSGDSLAVGAAAEASSSTGINGADNDSTPGSGAVYVFTRSGSVWSQQAYVKASNTGAGDLFGTSVSINGDTLAVGAPNEDSSATGVNGANNDGTGDSGAAYVFTRSGSVWTQQAYVKASNTGSSDNFGKTVTVSGDTLAVGAPNEASNATGINGNESDNSASASGAVYVFTRSGSVWTQQAYVKAFDAAANDRFGISLSLSGNTLAVGADGEASNATGVNGAGYADTSSVDSGAVYVFTRAGSTWTQKAYLKASNTETSDYFGGAVSVSGSTVAVGARREDSNATGIGGNQTDNSNPSAGAVYVFGL